MKSVSCSRYSLVRFEYSNSIGLSLRVSRLAAERVDQVLREGSFEHFLDRPLEANRPVRPHLDAERSPGHSHRHQAMAAEAVLDGGARYRARRRAGGEGEPRPPLPDEDVDLGWRVDARPLDVGAVGKRRVVLYQWAEAAHQR